MPGLPGLRGYDTATTVAMSKEEASVFLSSLLRHQPQERTKLARSSEVKAINWQWVWTVALDVAVGADLEERRVARTDLVPSAREDHASP